MSLPITCEQTIVNASHCVGFIFPGIMELPGSLDGRIISPIPDLGPDDKNLMSLAILLRLTAINLRAPWVSTIESWEEIDWNLFLAVLKGYFTNSEINFAEIMSYFFGLLSPVPTAVAPNAISDKWSSEFFKELSP